MLDISHLGGEMKILFSNAPWHQEADANKCIPGWLGIRGGSRWPHTMPYSGGSLINTEYLPFPFFLATAAALAKRNELNAIIRDSIAKGETYNEYFEYIKSSKPNIIVLETSTPSLGNDLEITKKIKSLLPSVIIIITGIHFELENKDFLENNSMVDFAVYGEFEQPVSELLLHLAGKPGAKKLTEISNLVYRMKGEIKKNPFTSVSEINTLPWPEREDLPFQNYFDAVCGLDKPQLQILTTRGCPYGCIFCVWPQLVYKSKSYRMRTPKDVVDEIEANLHKHPYKSFYIDDDTFNINKNHVLEFARELKKRGLQKISWGAMCRADLMTKEILLELKEAGLYSVKYGVESASQDVLDEISKNLNLQKVIDVIHFSSEIGIKVHLTFTFGLPNDTKESIEKTIQLACDLPSNSVQFSIATPFPGTKMYQLYDQKGWITTKNWDHYNGSATAVSRTEKFTGDQLLEFINQAYRRSAEARVQRILQKKEFMNKFQEKILEMAPKGSKILVLQSAIYTLTYELVRLLNSMGYETHLMLHHRFLAYFEDLVPNDRRHIFSQSTHFHYEYLKNFIHKLKEKHQFSGAIVPYSNSTGAGYKDVEKIAISAAGKIIVGVSIDGRIIRG